MNKWREKNNNKRFYKNFNENKKYHAYMKRKDDHYNKEKFGKKEEYEPPNGELYEHSYHAPEVKGHVDRYGNCWKGNKLIV